VKTRWSSFYFCLERIIELLEPLNFNEFGTEEEKVYLNDQNQLRLRLLCCIFEKVNGYILRFQTENMSILNVFKELKESLLIFSRYVFDLQEKKIHTDSEDLFGSKEYTFKRRKELYLQGLFEKVRIFQRILLRHSEFNSFLNESSSTEFFKIAYNLFKAIVNQMGARLLLADDGILVSDGFSLK